MYFKAMATNDNRKITIFLQQLQKEKFVHQPFYNRNIKKGLKKK